MTSAQFPVIETIAPPSRERFDKEIRPAAKPVIMRGIAKGWPAVEQAMKGVVPLFQYLSAMDTGQSQGTLVKKTEEREKFFYSDDLRTQNYETVSETASVALENLLSPPDNKTRYIQSVKLDDHFKGFSDDNSLPLIEPNVAGRAWIGGETTVQTHFDCNENIAICVLGKRELTLFPPDQLPNLYIGPLETAPGGANVSLTNLETPDFDTHPKFKEALKHAQSATLLAGDAIYIPYGWWHHVRALAPLNMLVNYWWSPQTAQLDNPIAAMSHAMMAFRGMPENQRRVWQNMFAQFVFMEEGEPMAHLPEPLRGLLGGVPKGRERDAIFEILSVLAKDVGLTPPKNS